MKNTDTPIYPILTQSAALQNETSLGLTIREYFAGLAMQSLAGLERQNSESHSIDVAKRVAIQSIYFADALLKELEIKSESCDAK